MKSGWLVWGLLFVTICGVDVAQTSLAGKTLSPLEESLISSEKSLIEAKKKDDGSFFKRTLSDDFSLVGVDGKLLERQEAVGDLGDSGLVELTPYDMKVVAAGDGAAMVAGWATLSVLSVPGGERLTFGSVDKLLRAMVSKRC